MRFVRDLAGVNLTIAVTLTIERAGWLSPHQFWVSLGIFAVCTTVLAAAELRDPA